MERDHLESHTGSFPLIVTPDSQEPLLYQNANDQGFTKPPLRFKSLHRPRGYSASSYASQPDEDADIAAKPTDYAFPTGRGRRSFQHDETTYRGRAGYAPIQGPSQLWLSFWLSKVALIGFLVLFAALLTGLLLVWYADEQRNGFYVATSTSPYTWTYGPTAVIVIIISLWRMVDHHVKRAEPWNELRRGPVVASRSLLLDYLSPLQLSSLWRALRNGHIAVVATIVGFIVLKVVAIFSTGLFVLEEAPIFDSRFPLNTTTKFDPERALAFNGTSALDPQQISNNPLYSWYGHIAQGLPYASGTNSEYVFQSFESAGPAPVNASFSATVDAFVPSANCSVMNVKLDGPSSIQGFDDNTNTTNAFPRELSLLLPDGDVCKHWSSVVVPVQDPLQYDVPARQLTGTYQGVFCSVTDAGSQVDLAKGPDGYLYTITDVRYTQKLFPNATRIENGSSVIAYANETSRTVNNVVNVFCLPHYTITKVNITNSTTGFLHGTPGQTQITRLPDAHNHTLGGFSAQNLSSLFEATAQASPNLFGNTQVDNSSAAQVPNVMFNLLAAYESSTDYSIFFDEQRLKSAAENVFYGLALEIAHQNLMGLDQSTMHGEAVYPLQRLYIRSSSLWVMAAGFGILLLMTVLVLFFAPSAVVSQDPSTIAAHASILARSPDLNRELRKLTTTSDQSLRSLLAPHFYRASVVASDSGPPIFKIQVQPGRRTGSSSTWNLPVVTWWHPLTLNSLVLITMVLLPIGAIVGLEFAQIASDRHSGLLTVPENFFSDAYTHYIPALVMMLIATFFTALDFNVAVFAPFSTLHSKPAAGRRTITSHLLGKTVPFAVLEALRSLQLGALLSLVGALVGSVLTIFVSDLYSVQLLSSSGPVRTISRLDVFNVTWANSYASDNGAAAALSLIEHQNLSYPNFTYGELVFPSLTLGSLQEKHGALSIVSGPAIASVPALRANLNCKILPESSYKVASVQAGPYSEFSVDEAFVNAAFDLPPQCQLAGLEENQSVLQYTNSFQLVPQDEFVYAGAQLDIVFGNGTEGTNYGETNGATTADNPPGCPSLAFTFGRFRLNSTDRTNVTTMVCYQEMQQVSAQVTFLTNSTTIDTESPPVIDEATVVTLANPLSESGSTAFEYRIQNNLLNEMATFNGSGFPGPGDVYTMDVFFQTVINGSDGTPEADLVGANNHERFYQAVNRLYRRYMAQVINANMRELCPLSGCPSDLLSKRQASTSGLQATVSISTPRLVQSSTSKLTLQILLGIMLFCGTLAYLLTSMRRVLPCNPCSIVGTMALLAGSKLCWSSDEAVCECCGKSRSQDADSMIHAVGEVDHHEEQAEYIPHGVEWMSDHELRKVFSKMRYTLGWWKRGYGDQSKGDGKRYGIDVGRADGLDDRDWELGRKRTRRYTQDERNARRSTPSPNWPVEPPKESEATKPQMARQSRMPEWMLGPLKPDKAPMQEHELEERRLAPAELDRDIGLAAPQASRNGTHQSRLPNWLLGPLKPDPEDEATRGAYDKPGDAFASGALRGPDAAGLGGREP